MDGGGGVNLGSAYGEIRINMSKLRTDLRGGADALRGFEQETARTGRVTVQNFEAAQQAATGLAIGLGAVAAAGMAYIRSATLTAARTQVLGTVVRQVGQGAGYTKGQLDGYVNAIKAMGITTQEARLSVVRFIQSELDLADAAKLARTAQDLAVIAGQNSSEAYQTLTQAIVSQRPILLKQYGIVKGLTQIYGDYAEQQGLVASALTETQKKEAFLQAIFQAGEKVAGSYEAAMGDVGKAMTSLPRLFEEIRNTIGERFLPLLEIGVNVVTKLAKGFLGLSAPAQAAITTVLGIVTALAALGSALLLIVPRLAAAKAAMVALGVAFPLGPLGAAIGIITALAGALSYLRAKEQAHREEAAALVSVSRNYRHYIQLLEDAGLESYRLSEGLYAVAKSGEEAADGIASIDLVNAAEDLEDYLDAVRFEDIERLVNLWRDDVPGALAAMEEVLAENISSWDDLTLMVLADGEALRRWLLDMGLAPKAAQQLTDAVRERVIAEQELRRSLEASEDHEMRRRALLDASIGTMKDATEAEEDHAEAVKLTADEIADLAKETGLAQGVIAALNTEFGLGADEIKEYAQALEDAREAQQKLNMTWADGLIDLREMGDEERESTADYRAELRKLQREAGAAYAKVREKFEDSLPDHTTVRERLEMASDAWDEWGLRLQDIIENGVASPFYEKLQEMGYQKPPDVGIREWAQQMRDAFYAGDLPDLINTDAKAWQDHAAAVKAAQDKETAAVAAGIAERKRALQQARQEELAAEAEKRRELMLSLALSLAEQTGALQAWAQQRFKGPEVDLSYLADEAAEVEALLKAGILTVDNDLGRMLSTYVANIAGMLSGTEDEVEANQQAIAALMAGDWVPTDEVQDRFKTALGPDSLLPPEDREAIGRGVFGFLPESMGDAVTGDEGVVPTFTEGMRSIVDESAGMVGDVDGEIAALPGRVASSFKQVQDKWYRTTRDMRQKSTAWANHTLSEVRRLVNGVNGMTINATISVSATAGGGGTTTPPTTTPPPPPPTEDFARLAAMSARFMAGPSIAVIRAQAAAGVSFVQNFIDPTIYARTLAEAEQMGDDFSYGLRQQIRARGW